jgi:hypothetical protein
VIRVFWIIYMNALQVTGKEPDMPLTYLLATPLGEGWEGPPVARGSAGRTRREYVESFSSGTLKKVRSPHYMEQAVPGRIAEEVGKLIASISQKQGGGA